MLNAFSIPSCHKSWYSRRPREGNGKKTQSQGTRTTPSARRAAPQARVLASRGGANMRGLTRGGNPVGPAAGLRRQVCASGQALGAPSRARCRKPRPARAPAQGRRARPGLCHRALDTRARGGGDRAPLRRAVYEYPRLAAAGESRLQSATARFARHRARRASDCALEEETLAGSKKTPPNRAA